MDIKEIDIPVPWGHVAAKTYGNQRDQFILVIHGVQDNCGTFERLIPHLPNSFYYVCIDLPSHGKSSYFPGNLPIHTMDYLIVYKIILDYFNRKKYIIMGHSYGGQIGYHFAQIYPEYVIKLILLDTIFFYPYTVGSYKSHILYLHNDYLKVLKNLSSPQTRPTYTYDEALNKLISSRRYGELTKETAEPILKRSIEKTPSGTYQFTIDPRLKCFVNPSFNMRMEVDLIKKYSVNCPHLVLLATDTPQWQYFKSILDVFRKNKKCFIKFIDGDHDVHNKHPERVAPYITKFLLKNSSKL